MAQMVCHPVFEIIYYKADNMAVFVILIVQIISISMDILSICQSQHDKNGSHGCHVCHIRQAESVMHAAGSEYVDILKFYVNSDLQYTEYLAWKLQNKYPPVPGAAEIINSVEFDMSCGRFKDFSRQ